MVLTVAWNSWSHTWPLWCACACVRYRSWVVNVDGQPRWLGGIECEYIIVGREDVMGEIKWLEVNSGQHCEMWYIQWWCLTLYTIGMLTVRIFGQFSFQFSFQFSIENESKIKSKIEGSMKMNLHGTFSWKAQNLFHFWVPFFTLGFILRFKFEGNDAPGWWHVAFGVRAACFFSI